MVVILNHLLGWPSGGFVGVDVFFVLSGFLITGLLLREHDRSGTISFSGFYRRRIKRIMPAAVLVLVFTLIASFFLTPGVRFARTAVDEFWALFFASNWNLAIQGTDYFQHDVLPSPVQHYWSLAVEEQFYFVWPWLMLGILALGIGRFGWGRNTGRLAVGVAIGLLATASFVYAIMVSGSDPNWAYFSSFSRAWELGVGALVAIFGHLFTKRSVLLRTVLSWIGVIGVLASFFVVSPNQGFPAPAAALPVLCCALVLLAGGQGSQPFLWPLTNRVSQYIGDISYSLYLWHFPVLILLLAFLPGDTPLYYGVAAALIVLLSVAAYHLVENPIRKSDWLTSKHRSRRRRRRRVAYGMTRNKVLVVGAAAVVCFVLLAFAVVRFATPPVGSTASTLSTGPASLLSAADQQALKVANCLGAPTRDPDSGCSTVDLGGDLRPAAGDAADDKELIDGKELCWIGLQGALTSCHYGSNDPAAVKVALVGDSHAQHLLPAFIKEAVAANWSIDAYVGDGCLLSSQLTSKCGTMQPQILDRVATAGAYDLVITQASRNKGVDSSGFQAAYQRVVDSNAKLAVISDNPSVSEDALLCYQRLGFDVHNNDCGTPRSDSAVDPQIAAAAAVPGAQLIDTMSFFCDEDRCPSIIGNVVVYRDTGAHITQTYSKSLSPYLRKMILQQTGL